jgi:uncharacterized phiE125 gp8 family phage protein
MRQSLKIYTQPTSEAVSLESAKQQLLMRPEEGRGDDGYIEALIAVARKACEDLLGRALMQQTWDLYLDEFPCRDDYIEVPRPPLQTVTYVKYKDDAGTLQTLAASNYIVDTASEPGRIALKYGQTWPSAYKETQAVQIQFVAGYKSADEVPWTIRQAILLKLTDLYMNRGDSAPNEAVDKAILALLGVDRILYI